jgi:hypothetical protein
LGLERYAPTFRDNEIDWEVLPKRVDSGAISATSFRRNRDQS